MHSQFLTPRAAAFAIAAALLGCGAPEYTAEQSQAVLDGQPTGTERGSVLYVTSEVAVIGGNPVFKIGSGTLVAPNLVATALHVVSRNRSDTPFICDADGHEAAGSQGAMLGPTLAADKVTVYAGPDGGVALAQGSEIISTGSKTMCQNDLAFVVLDQALELPTTPVFEGAAVEVGAELTAVGYGSDDPTGPVERTERAVNVVAVGQWIRTFTVSEGPCEGDSGGPTLDASGTLVGVFSSVAANCRGPTAAPKYTDISFFSSLVKEAFQAADAGSPWPESTGGAAGAGGESSTFEPPPTQPDDSGCSLVALPSKGSEPPLLLCSGLSLAAMWLSRRQRRWAELHDSRN